MAALKPISVKNFPQAAFFQPAKSSAPLPMPALAQNSVGEVEPVETEVSPEAVENFLEHLQALPEE